MRFKAKLKTQTGKAFPSCCKCLILICIIVISVLLDCFNLDIQKAIGENISGGGRLEVTFVNHLTEMCCNTSGVVKIGNKVIINLTCYLLKLVEKILGFLI